MLTELYERSFHPLWKQSTGNNIKKSIENCATKKRQREREGRRERNNFFSKKKKIDNKVSMRTDLKRNAIQRWHDLFRSFTQLATYLILPSPPPISIFSLAAGVQVAREFLITTLVRNLLDNVTGIRRQPISRKRFSSRHLPTRWTLFLRRRKEQPRTGRRNERAYNDGLTVFGQEVKN